MDRTFDELRAEVASVAILRSVDYECTPFARSHTWTASLLGLPIRFEWHEGRWAACVRCDRMPVTVYSHGLPDALVDLAHAFAEVVEDLNWRQDA